MTAHKPTTCCKDGSLCTCAQHATCSCGEKHALGCTCDKADKENDLSGPRCSCRSRPAGQCTCERASEENGPVAGATCSCGARPSASCTCEKAVDGKFNPANEIDFTTPAK
ncbi:hypothetical protein ACRE_051750 [Hapsidospora chrysogenum ATCC 11550]|uniref:DUF7871 domain-containing protein n=1 Tax=Hapsidospora chrysogenum (strain ATCC 11550 / CBS 779.69 / DSM 880 / IAM 14645 / JCM 23072 / IMI 49137) TaxID=857340 RepID=A0A086T3W8_HAPC1|nr:hypothetical protein ACRE_051750 [Hapsidospora chrysogenum ATCC 11550]